MKKSFTILFLLMSLLPMTAQTTFPDVSDGTTEHWYYIQMQNGMGVLTVQGENQNIVTAEAVQKKADMQQWKVVPATGNRYQFVSRGGQIMFYNGDRFKSSAAPAGGYSAFQIVQTSRHVQRLRDLRRSAGQQFCLSQPMGRCRIWEGTGMLDERRPQQPARVRCCQ